MTTALHFLIIDAYPEKSRDQFDQVGMTLSYKLYQNMLQRYLPDASCKVWLPSDIATPPDNLGPEHYCAVLWTGCNLTIYDDDERVKRQIAYAKRAYEVGTPMYGSCWALQMAVVAAGGDVKANPRGREMGFARRICLTDAGKAHPMMQGKPSVYQGFISHDDEVVTLPPNAVHLASNDFTRIQALVVEHKKGSFWATQYHPEYNLKELARLVLARAYRLVPEKFFADDASLQHYAAQLETLHGDTNRKDIRWQYDIDDSIVDSKLRQQEFANWITYLLLPGINKERA